MKIEEKDFYIKFNMPNYTLYKRKLKKELQEDPKEPFKVSGHFTSAFNAIQAAYKIRTDPKNLSKESAIELKQDIKELKKYTTFLINYLTSMNEDIEKLRKETFDDNRKI